ncbi:MULTISPECIES: LPS export ABC transporter ATP-binding protein [Selenomonas]|uniref:LPS export ABC transporter ATP-binding protein n=1 Tax=Selenomonas ruminis TaxID=2593411 RepID=A0A5D6WAI5_9FIRM|nr:MULTISPECIES: LPS export ABC transporter ATP-binding protein [unclassified Selenomonas]MDD6133155.1 LPS export ABC transporter ATP-binding protein [Selenomonadaceae bacterium]SDG12997.1 lipopolysaccharide export system ATP-binding protein [Selenomonas ruminantium]MBQ1866976.1 LPS export ABC transporter ATP-binding protein [Selenomonas sp.]MCR5440134.1 LPS export ABC transporter ATP-binding protein [Selenomonas sp.]TYZ23995.1 LPS export ABC transporter ATP-binding protein [Selenomonas sp. mP
MHIEAKNLVKKFKERTAVNRVSLRVEKGEIVGLLGPNGAGKTTTFYMIVGLEHPTSGEVYLSDIDITSSPMYKRAELGISYLTQEASIFRKLTVRENIMAILETTKLSPAEQQAKYEELIEEFHIGHVQERKGTELSGGERRRVEIARCLALEPQFILLDEPFAGVDPLAVADIQDIIQYLRQRGMGILITDHNVRETLQIVDRAYILSEGKILLEGDSQTIASSPIAKKFYLGENFTL